MLSFAASLDKGTFLLDNRTFLLGDRTSLASNGTSLLGDRRTAHLRSTAH